MIPGNFFAGMMGKHAEQLFEIQEVEKAVPKVKFE
jgi:hypothetical protein